MTDRTDRKALSISQDAAAQAGAASSANPTHAASLVGPMGTSKARKPYQRPSVQKRRSVHRATLISSGGTSGTLTSGGP